MLGLLLLLAGATHGAGDVQPVTVERLTPPRQVSIVWDVDHTHKVTTPAGIIRGGSSGGPPPPPWMTGNNGHAVNIYGNKGMFPSLSTAGVAVNGGVPQRGNLTLHLTKLRADLANLIPNASYVGHCLIDYEAWRADWNSTYAQYRNLSTVLAGGDEEAGKAAYEKAAQQWFLATIDTVRSVRPGCAVSWCGYPSNALPHNSTPAWVEYCKAHPSDTGSCLFDIAGDGRGSGYLGPGAAAQRMINDGLGWLFKAVDVIAPKVYLGIEAHSDSEPAALGTRAYINSTVGEALRLAAPGGKPVVAVSWFHYDDYWRVPTGLRALLTPTDLAAQLLTPLQAGASGLLMWGSIDPNANTTQGAAALQAYADGPLAGVMKTVCQTFRCCAAADPGCLPRPAR